MKNLKLLAALLALTIGLAGCGGSSKGGSPDTPDITAVVYCTTGRTLDWSPRLSAGTSSPEPVEGVDDFSNHPASGAAS